MNVLLRVALSISCLALYGYTEAMDHVITDKRGKRHKKKACNALTVTSTSSDKAVIAEITKAYLGSSIQYGLSISKMLEQRYTPERLTRILAVINNIVSDSDYKTRRRFLNTALVRAGADANFKRTEDHMSLLGQAVLYNDIPVALFLLQHGADPNVGLEKTALKAPLIWYANSTLMMEVLINYGAKIPTIGATLTLSGCDEAHYAELKTLFQSHAQQLIKKST